MQIKSSEVFIALLTVFSINYTRAPQHRLRVEAPRREASFHKRDASRRGAYLFNREH
jgi:hypothetical protein